MKRSKTNPKKLKEELLRRKKMRISVGENRTKTEISYQIYLNSTLILLGIIQKWRKWWRKSTKSTIIKLAFRVSESLFKRCFQFQSLMLDSITPEI